MREPSCNRMIYPPSVITYDQQTLIEMVNSCGNSYLNQLEQCLLDKRITKDDFFTSILSCFDTYEKRCNFEGVLGDPQVMDLKNDIVPAQRMIESSKDIIEEQQSRLKELKSLHPKILASHQDLTKLIASFNEVYTEFKDNQHLVKSYTTYLSQEIETMKNTFYKLGIEIPTDMTVTVTPPVTPPVTPLVKNRPRGRPRSKPQEKTALVEENRPLQIQIQTQGEERVFRSKKRKEPETNLEKMSYALEVQFATDVITAFLEYENESASSLCNKMYEDELNIWGFQALSSTFSKLKNKKLEKSPNVTHFFVKYFAKNIHSLFSMTNHPIEELKRRAMNFL